MNVPFKKEEKQPLNTPVIEMRKNSSSYKLWIIPLVLVALLAIFLWVK